MSAVIAVDKVHPARSPGVSRRGRLRLVGPEERAPAWRAGAAGSAPGRSLRLTRRGRLTLTLASTGVVAALVATMGGLVPAFGEAPAREVVVRPGQTLSQIAATELPDLPLDRAIVQIQLANQLNTLQVHAGQTLQITGP